MKTTYLFLTFLLLAQWVGADENQRNRIIPEAAEIWVDQSAASGGTGSDSAPFQTLPAGIAAATTGDRVTVKAGLYREIRAIADPSEVGEAASDTHAGAIEARGNHEAGAGQHRIDPLGIAQRPGLAKCAVTDDRNIVGDAEPRFAGKDQSRHALGPKTRSKMWSTCFK